MSNDNIKTVTDSVRITPEDLEVLTPNDAHRITLSEESMKVVEDAIANPPAPTAKLRELMGRRRLQPTTEEIFTSVLTPPDRAGSTRMQILKGREPHPGMAQFEGIPVTRPPFENLIDMGVPPAMARNFYMDAVFDNAFFSGDKPKEVIEKLERDIKLAGGNWCKFYKIPKPDIKVWDDRVEGYMQFAIYRAFVTQCVLELPAFRRMKEMEEDIRFYADAIVRDLRLKNEGDKYHWLTTGILKCNVVDPLLETGIIDHSKIIFFYEVKPKFNVS